MKSQDGLHLKTFVLILIIIILIIISLAPLGNTFLGKGMKLLPPMTSWAPVDLSIFSFAP